MGSREVPVSELGSSNGLPRRLDTRQALRIYVRGRSRGLDPDEKRTNSLAESPLTAWAGAGEVVAADEALARPALAVDPPDRPRGGFPVPERLDYHRSAGIWRPVVFEDRPASSHPADTEA